MYAKLKQTIVYFAVLLLLAQTFFGSLSVMATSEPSLLQVTMTSNGQPYIAGDLATAPVEIQVTTTSKDSATIEFSQDSSTWQPYQNTLPIVVNQEGNHTLFFRLVQPDGHIVEQKSYSVVIGSTAVQPFMQRVNTNTPSSAVIYVNEANTGGTKDGTSWATAYNGLQAALDDASNKSTTQATQIWMAKGTYTPTKQVGGTGTRYATFQMQNNVAIYGGFNGTETDLSARDWKNNETILSGEIGDLNDKSDNSYHVIYHQTGLNLDATAILDGVTITGGNANGSQPHDAGAGMSNWTSSPTVTNVTFKNNTASYGGGMANERGSSSSVTNVTFTNNTSYGNGGGMFNNQSSPSVTNVTFKNNTANKGGGMANFESSPNVTNANFSDNMASLSGGAIYNYTNSTSNIASSPILTNVTMSGNQSTGWTIYNNNNSVTIRNSIIVGNHGETAFNSPFTGTIENSLIDVEENGKVVAKFYSNNTPGTETYTPEKIFLDPANKDFQLRANSPAINNGSINYPELANVGTDIAGKPRIHDRQIDLGAYEAHGFGIKYDSNQATGGQEPDDLRLYNENEQISIKGNSGNLEKTDYIFTGWNTKADGTGTIYVENDLLAMETTNITLYANWELATLVAMPSITTQPTDKTVIVGGNVELNVVASGGTSLSYQWYKNTTNSTMGGTAISGATSATYTVPTTTAGTTYYYVIVTNTDNTATGNQTAELTSAVAKVEVNTLTHAAMPSITTQPTDKTVIVGGNVELNVVASGGTSLSYQWYKNITNSTTGGTVISGATSATYTVPTTTAGTTYYYVVVTNTDNTATGNQTATTSSGVTKVEVNLPPTSGGNTPPATESPEPDDSLEPMPSRVIHIIRTVEQGSVRYRSEVLLDHVQAQVQQMTNQNERTIRLVYPAETATVEAILNLSRNAGLYLNNQQTNLFMQTALAQLTIPSTSFNGITEDVFFRIVPVKAQQQEMIQTNVRQNQQIQQVMPDRAIISLLGTPVTIETNLQSRPITITLPILATLTEEQRASLVVYIEHSDGTTEVKRGRIVEFEPGVKGFQFEVDHFSTFSVVYASEVQEEEAETNRLAPYIQGYPDGTFKPNASVTRAQMAMMLARFLTNGEIPTIKATFDDTVNNQSKDAIEFVKQTGLFNGTTATTFNPNGTITRAQMAGVIARWIERDCTQDHTKAYCQETGKGNLFSDVEASHWAAASIEKVSALGIMSGTSKTTFNPNGALTRAQAVKVLNQLFERPVLEGDTTSTFKDVPSTHWAIGEIEAAATEMMLKK